MYYLLFKPIRLIFHQSPTSVYTHIRRRIKVWKDEKTSLFTHLKDALPMLDKRALLFTFEVLFVVWVATSHYRNSLVTWNYMWENTHRFYCLLQSEYFFLKKVQRSGFSAMTGKGCCAGTVNTVYPVFQFKLKENCAEYIIGRFEVLKAYTFSN